MRTAAIRVGGVVLFILAFALLWQSFLTIRGEIEESQLVAIGVTMLVGVLIAWVGTMLLRAPRGVMRATVALVIALLVPAAALLSAPAGPMQLTPRQREALEYLRTATYVEYPLVGFGGVYSRGYIAMRLLNRSLGADAAYKELIRTGTSTGQVYGLIGVHRTDPLYFEQAVLGAPSGHVIVFAGCVVGGEAVQDIINHPEAVEVRNHESLEQALKRQRGKTHLDIRHGGYAAMYFDTAQDAKLRDAERTCDFTRDR